MRTLGGFCLVLLLWSMPAVGRDIFIDNTAGDDRCAGRQPRTASDQSGPVRTIGKALRLATGGDTIDDGRNFQLGYLFDDAKFELVVGLLEFFLRPLPIRDVAGDAR